jgi:hypothetical protein
MKSSNTLAEKPHASSAPPLKSTRRVVDAAGLAAFHVAILGSVAWSGRSMTSVMALLAVPVLAVDALYFFSPPKRQPLLNPKPGADKNAQIPPTGSFAVEFLVLLVPPAILILWFLSLAWTHRTLTQHELIATLVIMPAVVGLVSWIIYLRMTRNHKGVRNNTTQFIALSMLAMWIGSTFLFVLLVMCFLLRK